MFTGIIETTGIVTSGRRTASGTAFTIKAAGFPALLQPGDSVAVNGVCLTVERCDANAFTATAVGETLSLTTLGKMRSGSKVNLERAATPETALGGHIVQGHVDGIGRIKSFEKTGADWLLTIELPKEVYEYVVPKGSVAVDGISLTVARVKPGYQITITVVPFTRERTLADSYRPGIEVNVEADIVGKYVKQYLSQMRPGSAG